MKKRLINSDLENRIFKKVLQIKKERKGYPSYWFSPDKQKKERGVVCDLLEAIEKNGERHDIVTVCPYTPDPPDCVGTTRIGEIVAFEVTELVDKNRKKMRDPWKEWSSRELIMELQRKIADKDSKKFEGGPYLKKILVIHTDEPLLRHSECNKTLSGQNFESCRQITEVYLLFSPEPARDYCPFLRLEIAKLV